MSVGPGWLENLATSMSNAQCLFLHTNFVVTAWTAFA